MFSFPTNMSSSDVFMMQWNKFTDNVKGAFRNIKETQEFSDVTLACKDSPNVEAHRLVLSASSPVFRDILRCNSNSHPVIYLRGIEQKYLGFILDFIYQGEVKICQEDLEEFLEVAKELKIKGMNVEDNSTEPSEKQKNKRENENKSLIQSPKSHVEDVTKETTNKGIQEETQEKNYGTQNSTETNVKAEHDEIISNETTIASTDPFSNISLGDITAQGNSRLQTTSHDWLIVSMMEKLNNQWVCTCCGMANRNKVNVRNHVEAKHTDGGSYPCTNCLKIFR